MTGAGPAQPSPAQPSPAQPPSIVQPRPGCGVVNRELRIPFEMYFHSLKPGAIAINGSVIIICSGAEEHSYRALLSIVELQTKVREDLTITEKLPIRVESAHHHHLTNGRL